MPGPARQDGTAQNRHSHRTPLSRPLGAWTSDWAFTYNTHSFVETGDIMRALGVGNGPIILVKATGTVHAMSSAYTAHEALLAFESGLGAE